MKFTTHTLLALSFLSLSLYGDDAGSFDKTLNLQGISFHITADKKEGESQLTLTADGLRSKDNRITRQIEGTVIDAAVADLNKDCSPEVYIYTVSDGSGSYGNVIAYSTNRKKSLSDIYLPPLEEEKQNAAGYMGHDSFSLTKETLVRKFPIYNKGDANCCPKGGIRQLEYTLVPGEATWQLKLLKSTHKALPQH